MKWYRALKVVGAVALTACVAGVSASVALSGPDSVSLFNGKDLTGWTRPNGQPPPGGWEVTADGAIHRARQAGDIVTERTFENFVLEFEFKAAPGANSGVKYRWGRYGRENVGMEYQVLADKNENPAAPGIHSTAALYDLIAPAPLKMPKPATEWNRARIVADGNKIEHWLNGEKVVSVTLGSPEWTRALQKSKFKQHEDFGAKPGRILLQEHGGEVWFRNIRLTELPTPDRAK